MEIIGALQNLTMDYATGKPIVSFLCEDKAVLSQTEQYKDKRLRVEVKQYREKRSLDANSYWHVLLGKLADALKVSKPYMKNFLLQRYGQYDMMDGKMIEFILKESMYDEVNEWETIHLIPTGHMTTMQNGQVYRLYYKLKGSHELNTEEMSRLIDGTIAECKEIGVETDTPDEIARLKALWNEKEQKQFDH